MKAPAVLIAAALALSGCMTGEDPGTEPASNRPWDFRIIMGNARWDTSWVYLNGGGRIEVECRELSAGGRCLFGNRNLYDSMGTWFHALDYTDGDSTWLGHPLHFEYGPDGKILFSRVYLPGRKQPYEIAEYRYDPAGRLKEIQSYYDFIGGYDTGIRSFGYDAEGRLDTAYSNDNLFSVRGVRFRYDGQGRLESLIDHYANTIRYERDAKGRIIRIVRFNTGNTREFTYEVEYRDSTVAFEPDPLQEFTTPGFFSL